MFTRPLGLAIAALPLALAAVARHSSHGNTTSSVVVPAAGEGSARRLRGPEPELPFDPNTSPHCTYWVDNTGGEVCQDIPAWWGITMADFLRWNPSITADCGNFLAGRSYCVEAFGEPPVVTTGPITSTTTTAASSTSTAGNGIATPEPIQPGIPGNCDAFHKVQSGDGCGAIATTYGISVAQLLQWNPEVGSNCQFLWLDHHICVSIVGVEPSTTNSQPPATTTGPGNGIATPDPVQPGIVGNCDAFHKVKSGDTCAALANTYGVSIAQLTSWNPEIGSNCQFIWLDYHICVSIIGVGPSQPPTSTTSRPGNGIATPDPVQPGIVGNCDAFHKIKSGDTCAALATTYGISVAQLTAWNPEIGSNCQFMWLDYHICVSIIGVGPSQPATTTTSRPGNGIATPTPIQPGMVSNCDAFHKVQSGDTCAAMASTYGISVAQLTSWNPQIGSSCGLMWLDYYLCVSIIGVEPTRTTSRPGNGIATPTPTQPGMVNNCRTFHLVKSGDTCATLAQRAGVTVATFISWNTGVGQNCQFLWLDTYYCIGR